MATDIKLCIIVFTPQWHHSDPWDPTMCLEFDPHELYHAQQKLIKLWKFSSLVDNFRCRIMNLHQRHNFSKVHYVISIVGRSRSPPWRMWLSFRTSAPERIWTGNALPDDSKPNSGGESIACFISVDLWNRNWPHLSGAEYLPGHIPAWCPENPFWVLVIA